MLRLAAVIAALGLYAEAAADQVTLKWDGKAGSPAVFYRGKTVVARGLIEPGEEENQHSIVMTEGDIPHEPVVQRLPNGRVQKEWRPYRREGQDRLCVSKVYFPDGKVEMDVTGSSTGCAFDGVSRVFYPSGRLKIEMPHANRKVEGLSKTYWENGKVQMESPYVAGKQEGLTRMYYESGALKGELSHRNGVMEGPARTFSQSGKLSSEGTIIQGLQDGDQKEYFEDGKTLKKRKLFRHGKVLFEWEYDRSGRTLKTVTPP